MKKYIKKMNHKQISIQIKMNNFLQKDEKKQQKPQP